MVAFAFRSGWWLLYRLRSEAGIPDRQPSPFRKSHPFDCQNARARYLRLFVQGPLTLTGSDPSANCAGLTGPPSVGLAIALHPCRPTDARLGRMARDWAQAPMRTKKIRGEGSCRAVIDQGAS
jgi:hypothetical protein